MVRHRGLFPFPVPRVEKATSECKDLSRSVVRRLEAQTKVDVWVRDVVIALNSMFSGEENWGSFEEAFAPTLSQKICLANLKQAVLDAGKPPDGITGSGALDELRTKPGYGDCANLAPMDLDLLSLPKPGSTAASMEVIFGEAAEGFSRRLMSKVSADVEVKKRLEGCEIKMPYVDPSIRHCPRKYAEFCRMLHQRGLVEFHTSFKQQVGVFTVWKKNGKQRLVIDARLANLHFDQPEKVELATGSTFACIEVDNGEAIEVGGVDISDAFYHIQLIPELRPYFAPPGLKAMEIGDCGGKGLGVGPHDVVYPCLRVVPMGWTHALWLCQAAHEHVVDCNPYLDPELRCVDRRPVPEMRNYIHTQYVDNFVAFSQESGKARALAEMVGAALNRHGLPTHDVEASKGMETLGWLFAADHPTVRITNKRLWKMRLATLELIRRGRGSGRLIERLVGHFTFAGLIRRGFLSVFQATYVFIRKHYAEEVDLWPEVQRELKWAAALLCLLKRDLSAEWSTRVHASDASLWGRGIVSAEREMKDIKSLGRRSDRWRFNVDEEMLVPKGEIQSDLLNYQVSELSSDASVQLGSIGKRDSLEVPLEFIGEDWKNVDGAKWERVESIPILEGRSVVWLLQHLARSQKNLGKKHLLLTDSMSVTLALAKGRSSCSTMTRICRQVAAVEFMTGMHIHLRWIPSELNPADLPSRAQSVASFNLRDGLWKFLEGYVAEGSEKAAGWRSSAARFYLRHTSLGKQFPWPGRHGGEPTGDGLCDRRWEGEAAKEAESRTEGPATWTSSRHHGEGRQDLLGAPGRDHQQGEELRQGMGWIQPVGGTEWPPCREFVRPGPRGHQQAQCDVLRGTGSSRRRDFDGISEVSPGRCGPDNRPPQVHGGHEGVQKVGAGPGAPANALSDALRGGEGALAQSSSRGHVVAGGVGHVLSAGRGTETSKEGPCSAFPNVSPVDCDPQCGEAQVAGTCQPDRQARAPARHQADLEGRRAGRGSDDRPALHEGARTNAAEVCQAQGTGGPAVRLQHARCHHALQQEHCGERVQQSGDCVHLSAATWQRVDRRPHGAPRSHHRDEAGAMAISEKRPPLLQRRPHFPSVRGAPVGGKGQGHTGRVMDVRDFRCWHLNRQNFSMIGLEIFSGSGHFSRAMRRRAKGVLCVEVDINHGPQFDLTKPSIQKELIKLLVSGRVAYVWLGTPCSSWSRARRWDGRGPGPLRDDDCFLMGYHNLSVKDAERVRVGNILMAFSAKIFRICMKLKIPITLENPHTSRLWLARPIQHLLHHRLCDHGFTDFCQDGKPFRKRTRLLWCNVDLRHCLRHCCGRRGLCCRTGVRHQQLQGTEEGQFRTLLAQPYPPSLCQRLAIAFQHALMAPTAAKLWKRFQGL